jgi:hypothetical protein
LSQLNYNTRVLVIDDIPENFDFTKIFPLITEKAVVERKYQNKYTILFERSPKIVITTNYSLKGVDESTKRRKVEFIFADYFNSEFTPDTKYNNLFFTDWDKDEWENFYLLMAYCIWNLVYKQIENSLSKKNACCAAQMFLDSGDGMVFRGNIGPWFNPKTKEFHISKKDAFELLSLSLEAFREKSETSDYPNEIFIHAKTYFDNEEWDGFSEAAYCKSKLMGIRIREDSSFKLYRDFSYCVPRGTSLIISENFAYLWTKGYIPRIQTQLGTETPNSVSVEVTRGEIDIVTVCKDILALTKLNYNACIFADGSPVTLRFADSIGEVLTAGKDIKSEVLPFKHYV